MAFPCSGSVSASWWPRPASSYDPSSIRFGHGMSNCPRPEVHISSAAYPSSTSRPSTLYDRSPPPTSTTTARCSPKASSNCSPEGGIVAASGEIVMVLQLRAYGERSAMANVAEQLDALAGTRHVSVVDGSHGAALLTADIRVEAADRALATLVALDVSPEDVALVRLDTI